MEKPNELFLIMSNKKFRYCLYRVCEPESNGDEDVIYTLDEPIMKLHNKSCPDGMSFAVVGRNIYMVGGYYACSRNKPFRLSKETIIFDTLSNTYAPGPPLISPKPDPFLFTVGSKLFALSCDIYAHSTNPFVGPKPRFEVLNTEELESGWRALRVPRLYFTKQHNIYPVVACVALSSGIFISVEDAGTYAFDLDKEVWNYVSEDRLPFADQVVPMPPNLPGAPPSLCFAASTKGCGYSAFHIRYETEGDDDKRSFKVDEIEFGTCLPNLSPEIYYKWSLTTIDNNSLVYLIDSGIDNAHANDTNNGNRYVKVQVCDVKFSKAQLLKKIKRDSNPEEFLKKGKKMKIGGGEEKKIEVGGGGEKIKAEVEKYGKKKGGFLKNCTSSEPKREFKGDKEMAEVKVEDTGKLLKVGRNTMRQRKKRDEDETLEFKLNTVWRRSFFGGPMVDIGEHVYAAFAIKVFPSL